MARAGRYEIARPALFATWIAYYASFPFVYVPDSTGSAIGALYAGIATSFAAVRRWAAS